MSLNSKTICSKLDFLALPDPVIRDRFRTVDDEMIRTSTLQTSWGVTLALIRLEPLIPLLLSKRRGA